MSSLPVAVESRLRQLPRGLREHIERSREVGQELAAHYGVDAFKVDLGIAAHDLMRATGGDVLIQEARRYCLEIHPVERHSPILLHGPVAAAWLERECGVSDPEVLEAVRFHTTGKPGMGPVAKVVFLADKLDPVKAQQFPYLAEVKELSKKGLDIALLGLLDRQLVQFLVQGYMVHPNTVELRNELLVARV